MKSTMQKLKGGIARLVTLGMLFQMTAQPVHAVAKSIPVDVDLTNVLVAKSAQVDANNTFLVNWRNGPLTSQVGNMTFAYLTGTGRAYPTRSSVLDHTGNDQGDLWSDDAIQFVGTNPNKLGSGVNMVLIYTNNTDGGNCNTGTADPLCGVSLRGGVIGGFGGPENNTNPYRVSELPLIWKAVGSADLTSAQGANPLTGSPAVQAISPLYMPTEIVSTTGGNCPTGSTEGPYSAGGVRASAGFCDFSSHFFIDQQNNIHAADPSAVANSWYTKYAVGSANYLNAFSYATLVGPFGANTTETGLGVLPLEPLASGQSSSITGAERSYFVLGMTARNALLTHYGTTINIDLLSE